ncbi:MAG: right-handed parallel beta-helix repeat-containing protein, partial [Desulfuromonadales bacterium]|nr:right-handed parallel beta-helix repeat-containing protein [Desulfuromonadales bacterium]
GGVSWYNTIQLGIDAINGAHTVLVYEGTYNEEVLFEFGSNDNNTTLRSVCGPDTTIISGSGSGSVVTFNRYSNSQIDGFQVTGGTTGINVTGDDSQATITNCQIHDNHGLYGGGISVDNSVLTLTNSEIYNNSSDRGAGVRIWRGSGHIIDNTIIRNNTAVADGTFDGGGGVYLSQIFSGGITISNSVIRDNETDYPGGGIRVAQVPYSEGAGLTVSDSIISGNTAAGSWGGGVFSDNSRTNFIRTSITGNTADSGGAIAHPSAGVTTSFENCILADNQAAWAGMAKMNGGTLDIVNSVIANNRATDASGGAIYNQLATITIHNSILWGNQAASVGHFAHFNGGSITITDSIIQNDDDGDFTDAPFFTDSGTTTASGFTSEDDPWFVGNGDYHIQGPSPAINNASATYAPALDIDGESRPQGAADDIGADEYYP